MLVVKGQKIQPPPGVIWTGPGEAPWAKLSTGDYQSRSTSWIRQIIIHTTKGEWPQKIIPGVGPQGREQLVADFWRGDPEHSAAQIVIGSNGKVGQLADLFYVAAYHATWVNNHSIGIEVYQEKGGVIYQAALDTLSKVVPFLCEVFGIPKQVPHAYSGSPIFRLAGRDGGPHVCGVFGHCHQTVRRGRGDPGDYAFSALPTFRRVNYDVSEDLDIGRARQKLLVARGERLDVDGVWGPASDRAMHRQGFRDTLELDSAIAA